MDLAGCLVQLENAMRTLTMNPGKFDSLVSHLVDTISPFLDQASQCEEIFNLIIQQVIAILTIYLQIFSSIRFKFYMYLILLINVNNSF